MVFIIDLVYCAFLLVPDADDISRPGGIVHHQDRILDILFCCGIQQVIEFAEECKMLVDVLFRGERQGIRGVLDIIRAGEQSCGCQGVTLVFIGQLREGSVLDILVQERKVANVVGLALHRPGGVNVRPLVSQLIGRDGRMGIGIVTGDAESAPVISEGRFQAEVIGRIGIAGNLIEPAG